MIEKQTVFILGAGASCPYGFLTAGGLREDILSTFADHYGHYLSGLGRDRMVERTMQGYPQTSDLKPFLQSFEDSSTQSIDLFLSGRPTFQQIGKMAICLGILHAERLSGFREKAKKREHDWYYWLFNKLRCELAGRDGYKDLGKNNIACVTFNYDRSLEYFLFTSLLNSFEGADPRSAAEKILQIPIVHAYGQVAPLEWQSQDKKKVLPYGTHIRNLSQINLMTLTENLYVIHEERTNPELEKARTAISEAERIFFLGFGYADENLKALGIPGTLKPTQLVYGTTMGFTEKERKDMQIRLADGLRYPQKPTEDARSKVHLKDCDCVALLREFL